MTITLQLPALADALRAIREEGFNKIFCTLTGVQVGTIDDSEIELCLRMELARDPLLDSDSLVDDFAMRFYAMSSGPAPSLRVHRDHNALVRTLRLDAQGPNRLFGYLAGRLLFDSMVRKQEVHTYANTQARLNYLIEFQEKLRGLPEGWHKSLTPEDEAERTAQGAIAILDMAAAVRPTAIQEAKAAQRCLEALFRLDAIHSLRDAFYNAELRAKLSHFRESHDWTFTLFALLLKKIEEEGVIKARQQRDVRGNSMVLTAALESISWSTRRTMDLTAKIEEAERKGIRVNGDVLLNVIKQIQEANPTILTDNDRRKLDSAAKSLTLDLNSVRFTDKRLASLQHIYGKSADNKARTQVSRGAKATKSLVESYLDAGASIPAPLKQKMDSLVKAGEVAKAGKKSASGKPAGKMESKIGSKNMNMLAGLIKGSGFKHD